MDDHDRLDRLARITAAPTPVVSVYLDTRWSDEHQRDRVRVFVAEAIAGARDGAEGPAAADLQWVQDQATAAIEHAGFEGAHGLALFACEGLGLRDAWPLRVSIPQRLVVAPAPFLTPLVAALGQIPPALAVFVDTESARLIAIDHAGVGEEVALEAEVPGHHRRGGWAQLAQSRYQRHIQHHAHRHLEAVAEALGAIVEGGRTQRIVLAGPAKSIALLRQSLPPRTDALVAGVVSGARHESAAPIAERAVGLLGHVEAQRVSAEVDATLVRAAKGTDAAVGLEDTLDAVNRGAVHRLYVLQAFRGRGQACAGCGTLAPGEAGPCRRCGAATVGVHLDAAMAARVIAAGGAVEPVALHRELAERGGIAAALRYAV